MNQYIAGTLVRCSVAFTNLSGAAVDPTTVTAAVELPDDTALASPLLGTPTRDSTGNWHVDVDTTGGMPGVWEYQINGTGAAEVSQVGRFYVAGLGS